MTTKAPEETSGRPLRVFLVAAEPSGDALGAGLIAGLSERLGDGVEFGGVGGPRMESQGVKSAFDIAPLAIVGLFEGVKVYTKVLDMAQTAADLAIEHDAAVLIDSWGFTVRVAERIRKQRPDFPIIKYVGPQVWASRPGRARKLASRVDHVLTLQPFEPAYFEEAGLPATFVGHPSLDERREPGDADAFRTRYQIADDQQVLAVLFGSRATEARRLTPVFADAVAQITAQYANAVRVISPLAASIATQIRAAAADDPRLGAITFLDEPEKADAFAAADLALACSGTVVTELAQAGTPTVVAYKLGLATWTIARMIVHAPHISLVNMAAEQRIFPEFTQFEATGDNLAQALSAWLDDPAALAKARAAGVSATDRMRGAGGSAFARAADASIAILQDKGLLPRTIQAA